MLVVPERTDVSQRIAVRRLDADDVRAEIGEKLRRVHAGLAGEVEDADVVESGFGHRLLSTEFTDRV